MVFRGGEDSVLHKGLPAEDPETLHYPDRVPSLIQMGQVLI